MTKMLFPILEDTILRKAKDCAPDRFSLFCIIQQLYPQDWRHFRQDILEAAKSLAASGKIKILDEEFIVFEFESK